MKGGKGNFFSVKQKSHHAINSNSVLVSFLYKKVEGFFLIEGSFILFLEIFTCRS